MPESSPSRLAGVPVIPKDRRARLKGSAAVAARVSSWLEDGGASGVEFGERELFVALCSSVWHVHADLNGVDWYGRWHRIRSHLVESNLGLIGFSIKRWGFGGGDWDRDELYSAGLDGLLKAVDRFDPWRGYRFSTYGSWVIRGSLSDLARRARRLERETFLELHENLVAPRRGAGRADPRLGVLHGVLRAGDGCPLDPRERLIILWRFPLDGSSGRTLREIGCDLGVTKERVRQIQIRALKKLRRAVVWRGVEVA